jgi:hypothetical protein
MATPIPFDEAIADAICDAIATQAKGLGQIIQDLDLALSPSLIYKWLQQNELFRERYARARADQAQVMADEIMQIADSTQLGEIVTTKGDGTIETKRADMIEHRKLRIDSRKWLASKLLPKVYGDKIEVKQTDNPLTELLAEFRKEHEALPPDGA